MEIYLNYARFWWYSTPLLLLGLITPLFVYIYWAAFILFSLNLIFIINNSPKESSRHSVSHYQHNIRLNILNFAIALFLTISNFLIVTIPIIPKALLIAAAWWACAWLLKRYAARTLEYIHLTTLVSYLQTKVPEVPKAILQNIAQAYFSDSLPAKEPLAGKYNFSLETSDKIHHYYNSYIKNNHLNGDLSTAN